jgi:hypothetical protein
MLWVHALKMWVPAGDVAVIVEGDYHLFGDGRAKITRGVNKGLGVSFVCRNIQIPSCGQWVQRRADGFHAAAVGIPSVQKHT